MKSFNRNLVVLAALASIAVGCAGDEVGSVTAPLAPAGSNASFVSNTIPIAMAPGERRVVTVTATNTGATPGVNDWTIGTTSYYLYRVSGSTSFGWVNTRVPALTPVGSNATFTFTIVAPTTPGSYNFRARMFVNNGGGFFGPVLDVPVVVSAATTPAYACAYEAASSSVPTTIPPGANQSVTVAVRNTGTASWTASTFRLYSTNTPTNLWNVINVPVGSTVAPGGLATFTFSVRAPSTSGVTPFRWDMFDSGGIGFFGQNCVNLAIDVNGSQALNSLVAGNTLPATMAPGETRTVTVSMENTGTQTWTAGSSFALYPRHSPAGFWGATTVLLTSNVATGEVATFSFPFTSPTTAGIYPASYQMRKLDGADAGFFGATFSTTVDVNGSVMPQYACAYVPGSSTVPSTVIAGSSTSVTVAVQNTGTATWTPASSFHLYSRNTPQDLWGLLNVGLPTAVAPGETGIFTFTITAPSATGTTPFVWDMFQSSVGYFGANCVNVSIDVGAATLDLASTFDGRTLFGGTGTFLEGVTVGDVNDDAVPDVVVSQLTPPAGVARNQCGTVYGFIGGAGFFTGTQTTVPSDAAFTIVGAEAGDQLGHYLDGNVVVGDVTGDGVEDIIVGAPSADGPMNGRTSAGEVYVIAGGLGLSTAGTIDLGATTPPTQLVATIYGAAAGDVVMPVAVADLTGDGINDLILAAQQTGTGGSGVGAVYVVAGTVSGLSGTLDLAAPGATTVHTITGATSSALGRAVAVGNFMGGGNLDLLLGAGSYTHINLRDGAAWAFTGPITSDRNVATADATWYGRSRTDQLGAAVAIADVRGTGSNDVIISASQYIIPGVTQPGGVEVFDGPIAPGVYDLSISEASVTALILGVDNQDNFGTSMRTADFDGDGRMDIVVAARAADGPGNARTNAGEFVVIRGGSTLTGTIDLSTASPLYLVWGDSGLMGSYHNTLSTGDIDGDGLDDICVGSHGGQVDCVRSPF